MKLPSLALSLSLILLAIVLEPCLCQQLEDLYMETGTTTLLGTDFRGRSINLNPNMGWMETRNSSKILEQGFLDEPEDDSPVAKPEDLEYFGRWTSPSQRQQEWFRHQGGRASFYINLDQQQLAVTLNDGEVVDQRALQFFISFTRSDINRSEQVYSSHATYMMMHYRDRFSEIGSPRNCSTNFTLSLYNATSEPSKSHQFDDAINGTLTIHSEECDIQVVALCTSDDKETELEAMNYAMLVTLVCCIHIYSCIMLIKRFNENESIAGKYSMITFGFFTCWDIIMGFFHLYTATLRIQLFQFFMAPALWYFILATVFETRILMYLWSARNRRDYYTVEDLRRGAVMFYTKFYGGLFALMFLASYYLYENWCLVLSSLFFIPQIVHNAVEGHRFQFDCAYVIGLGLTRALLPFYAKGLSSNVFHVTQSYSFCISYGTILLLQCFCLLLQSKLGSRFFIPRCLMPQHYNYYIQAPPLMHEGEQSQQDCCAICIEELSKRPVASNAKKTFRLMKTPCGHMFHEECCKGWLDIKLECPLCKSALPVLND